MMSTPKSVLYVGNDHELSKASAALLKRAGYRPRTTTPLNAAGLIRDLKVSVIVLCATLSRQETDEVVEVAENMQPGVPIVSVHLGLLGDGPHPASSAVVDALQGPEALLQTLQMVMKPVMRAS